MTDTQKAPKGARYSIDADGVISRTAAGEPTQTMGVFDKTTGVLTYASPEAKTKGPAILAFLKQAGLSVTAKVDGWTPGETAPEQAPEQAPINEEPAAQGIPPAPELDPQLGDKTPAYVEWLARYKPEEFRQRFGVIGEGTVPKRSVVVRAGKRVIETVRVPALLARRVTHMTKRPVSE